MNKKGGNMDPQARHARYNLIVCAMTLVLTSTAYGLFLHFLGPHRARGAFGFFGLLGLLGLGPAFYHRKRGVAGVVLDERDKEIGDRSSLIAWRAVWVYWGVLCMGVWLWVAIRSGLDAVEAPFVPAEWLPWALMLAFLVFSMAWSIAVLISYRRGESEADE
jgi:hypothetical protein